MRMSEVRNEVEGEAYGVINSEAISRAARKRPIRINREIKSGNLSEEGKGREGKGREGKEREGTSDGEA